MSDEDRAPGLDSLVDLVLEEALENARTMMPARVTAYDEVKQRASIQVLIQEEHIDELGNRVSETVAEIHGVPVRHLGSQPTGRITVPVAVGDQGMAIFASASIARWKLRGGIVDPGQGMRRSLNDCVFEPGLHDFAHVPTSAPTDAIVTHGPTKIGGPDADQAIVVQAALNDFMDALTAAMSTDTSGALGLLKTQLEALNTGAGWKARTGNAKAK